MRNSRRLSRLELDRVIGALNTLIEAILTLDETGRIEFTDCAFSEIIGRVLSSLTGLFASDLEWNPNGGIADHPVVPGLATSGTAGGKDEIRIEIRAAWRSNAPASR